MWDSIVDFATGAFDNVVNWVVGDSGSVVEAVAGDALKGAVYGAVVGAAHSAITGGDIKKGALRGAAVGGISTGIASSLKQMANIFYEPNATAPGFEDHRDPAQTMNSLATGTDPTQQVSKTPVVSKYLDPADTGKKWWEKIGIKDDDAKGKVIGGILQGGATGAFDYLTAQNNAKADRDLMAYKAQLDREKIAASGPGTNYKLARLKKIDWWSGRTE